MGPTLRCKLKVSTVTQEKNDDGSVRQENVRLDAVYGADGTENGQWSKYTPSASFGMCITNPAAFGKLPEGSEFYVDFTPAGQAEAAAEPAPCSEPKAA